MPSEERLCQGHTWLCNQTLFICLWQDLNHLRKAISRKADKEAVEADLERIHQALRCKANVHAMSEALSQKLDVHSYLTATASTGKIGAYDPAASPSKRVLKA